MTGWAFALLVATAVLPVIVAGAERIAGPPPHPTGGAVRLGGALVVVAVGGVAAALAAAGGTAAGAVGALTPVTAAVAAVTGGGLVVRAVLRVGGVGASPAPISPDPESPAPDSPVPDSPAPDSRGAGATETAGPLRGGRVIGYLERLAVVTTLLVGWPEGLAIILAVKSLARYPELRAAHASEQFIMGTFASVLWAAGMAGISSLLLA